MCRCEVRRHLSHLGPDAHMCVPSASTSLETLDCIDPPISLSVHLLTVPLFQSHCPVEAAVQCSLLICCSTIPANNILAPEEVPLENDLRPIRGQKDVLKGTGEQEDALKGT